MQASIYSIIRSGIMLLSHIWKLSVMFWIMLYITLLISKSFFLSLKFFTSVQTPWPIGLFDSEIMYVTVFHRKVHVLIQKSTILVSNGFKVILYCVWAIKRLSCQSSTEISSFSHHASLVVSEETWVSVHILSTHGLTRGESSWE